MDLLERRVDLDDVREKYRRKNQLLFSRESACLQDLIRLICLQKHRTIVLWAFTCAEGRGMREDAGGTKSDTSGSCHGA